MTPGLSSIPAGRIDPGAPIDSNRPQCFALEPTAEVTSSRRNSPSNLVHFHASDVRSVAGGSSYSDGSAGNVGRCNGLTTRSLKPRHGDRLQRSNRYTLKPCAAPASGANSTHPSPSARPFRLPFNGLAQSELRRIFCSDEGAGARWASPSSTSGRASSAHWQ